MITNFAAAMRRAALSTRAYDPVEATRIIQDALAQTGFQQSASDSKRPPSLRLIDPGAEVIPSSRTQYEPGQRKRLGDVLRILKEGKSRFRGFDTLRNRSVGTPPPPIADGAIYRSVIYLRGRSQELQAVHSCLCTAAKWPHRDAAWL